MPELPEVETVKRGLEPDLTGLRVTEVACHRQDLRYPLPDLFAERLQDTRIVRLSRRSKYLLMHLDNGLVLVIHFGMSGTLRYSRVEPETLRKHDHVVFYFDDESVLTYHDPRRFGLMELCAEDALETHALFAHLGPEPLSPAFDGAALYARIHHRNTPIKQAIMDAENVVGVGNIYACESLFRAKIHPATPCSALSKAKVEKLVIRIKQVLEEAIASGGSTLRDYVRSSGDLGYFQHHFLVYGRQKEPCFTCKTPVERITQSNRSSFFCPACQALKTA